MYPFASSVLFGQGLAIVAAQSTFLNVTALAGVDNRSVIQCWQIEAPFSVSTDAGTNGVARINLSNTTNVSYMILPSNYDGGLHTAPAKQ